MFWLKGTRICGLAYIWLITQVSYLTQPNLSVSGLSIRVYPEWQLTHATLMPVAFFRFLKRVDFFRISCATPLPSRAASVSSVPRSSEQAYYLDAASAPCVFTLHSDATPRVCAFLNTINCNLYLLSYNCKPVQHLTKSGLHILRISRVEWDTVNANVVLA